MQKWGQQHMERKKVLIVDDEAMIREAISSYLEKKGFQAFSAENGLDALAIFRKENIDFVILDLMLPDLSGEEVCMKLRQTSRVPILMLTAKTMEEDQINGLQIGADDYMTKPFSLKLLYARMETILRRVEEKPGTLADKFSWNHGGLEMDLEKKTVIKNGEAIGLTPIEWKLFSALAKYPQKIYTRDELINIAFDPEFDGYDRVIDTHIKNLRKKIEDDPKNSVYIRTVHGLGYKFGGDKV